MNVQGVAINMTEQEYSRLSVYQDGLVDMLQSFDVFCDEHNLSYMVGYAGVVGAMIFKGFIPWDDDLDLLMPRKDYNRLKALAGTYIDSDKTLLLVSTKVDPNSTSFIKLRKVDSIGAEHHYDSLLQRTPGAAIDIVPLDSVPDNIVIRKLLFLPLYLIFTLSYIKIKLTIRHKAWLAKLLPSYRVLNVLGDAIQRAINRLFRRSNTLAQLSDCVDLQHSVWHKEDIYPIAELPFEGLAIPVPHNADRYLTARYGRWGVPPFRERTPPHKAS